MNILAAVQLWDSTTDPNNWIFYTDPSHYPVMNTIMSIGQNVFFWGLQIMLAMYTIGKFQGLSKSIFSVAQTKIKTFPASVAGFTDGGMMVWLARRVVFVALWLAYFQVLFAAMWVMVPGSVGQVIYTPFQFFQSFQGLFTNAPAVAGVGGSVPVGQHLWTLLNYFIPVAMLYATGLYVITVEVFAFSNYIVFGMGRWLSPE